MTRRDYFQVAQVLRDNAPNEETGTVSQKNMFGQLVNTMADYLAGWLDSGEASSSLSTDIRGFRDYANGIITTIPKRRT